MSFRKRSVKPNLAVSKRPNAKVTLDDAKEGEQTVKAEEASRETSHPGTNVKETRVEVDQFEPGAPRQDKSDGPTAKKLGKRTKVAPKLPGRSARAVVSSSGNNAISSGTGSIRNTNQNKPQHTDLLEHEQTSLTRNQHSTDQKTSNQENTDHIKLEHISTPKQHSTDHIICNREIADHMNFEQTSLTRNQHSIDQKTSNQENTDRIKPEHNSTPKQHSTDHSICNREIADHMNFEHNDSTPEKISADVRENTDGDKHESLTQEKQRLGHSSPSYSSFEKHDIIATDHSLGEPPGEERLTKANRLAKRRKVVPYLAERSSRTSKQDVTDTSISTASGDGGLDTPDNNRLAKRKKVAPKLTERATKTSEQTVTSLSANNELSGLVTATVTCGAEGPSNNICNTEEAPCKATQKEQCGDDSTSSNNPIEALACNSKTLKIAERKHVHFTDEQVTENSLQILSQVCSAEASHRQSSVNDEEDGESLKHDQSHPDDRSGYNSQSDGEASTSLNLSAKRKTFKPNLGQRRRKRLSSFSAYSSCDEDNEDVSSKKKQAAAIVSDKSPSQEEDTKAGPSKRKVNKKSGGKKRKKEKENQNDNVCEDEVGKVKKPVKKRNEKCSAERELSTLTMQELIHYRPRSFVKVKLRSEKEPIEEGSLNEIGNVNQSFNNGATEDKKSIKNNGEEMNDEGANDEGVVAPQVMLNEDGEIVINEDSLTLKKKIDDSAIKNSPVLHEDALSCGNNHRRKSNRGKRWTIGETLRFYKALSQIGTDFTLMSQVFERFTRNEIKKKFKQEEKVNCDLVDRALANRLPLNMEMFLRGKEELRDFLEAETQSLDSPAEPNNDEEQEDSLPAADGHDDLVESNDHSENDVKMVDPT